MSYATLQAQHIQELSLFHTPFSLLQTFRSYFLPTSLPLSIDNDGGGTDVLHAVQAEDLS